MGNRVPLVTPLVIDFCYTPPTEKGVDLSACHANTPGGALARRCFGAYQKPPTLVVATEHSLGYPVRE